MVKHSDGTFGSDADTFAGVAATGFLDLSNAALSGPSPNDKAAPPDAPVQIVFIEANVPDAQDLANGVKAGVQVVLLDPSQDGVTQIADYLTSHNIQNLAAIDIVAHGADGALQLGSATLSSANIADYQAQLAAIGAALIPGGDLQLYGCDVGEDAAGVSFLDQLSQATGGANIAAASHLVGDAAGGGSFNLNVNVGTVDVATPFTAAALTSYQGELAASTAQLYFTSDAGPSTLSGATQVGVSGSIAGTQIRLASGSSSNQTLFGPEGIAFDAPLGKYFISNENNSSGFLVADILEGNIGSAGTPTEIYHFGASSNTGINQIAIDQPAGELFFTQLNASSNPFTINTVESGIFEIPVTNSDGTTATQVIKDVSGGVTLVGPHSLALDVPDNLIFFTDTDGPAAYEGGISRLVVGNMTTGNFTVLTNFPSSITSTDSGNQQNDATNPSVAIDTATHTIYIALENSAGNPGQNFILSAQYSVTGSGNTASAIIGAFTTLYSGAGADYPSSITIDPADGIFYTTGFVGTPPGAIYPEIFQGSLSNTGAGSLTPVTNLGTVTGNGDQFGQVSFESIPTITASGSVNYFAGGSAVTLDSGVVVTNEDGQNLASATVVISGGTFSGDGDTLVATAVTGITASYNATTETLTLTGNETLADYEQVLDSVTFSSTSANPTNSGADTSRTISWSGSDGVIASATSTSTVDVHVPPVVTAGATVTFDGGGAAVKLDSGLTVTDASSTTLASATIVIVGSISADRLNFSTQNSITGNFNTTTGTLVLSGVASVSNYQTALESITYSVSPGNSDPTGGGSDTTRTIDWSVNDGVLNSGTVTSTLDTVHVAPTVTTGGTVTFDGGGSPVPLDPGLTVTDVDSAGVLSSATVTVASAITGDTLNFTNSHPSTEGNIAVATDSNGVLVLTSLGSTATVAQWQTALESVTYSFSPSDGDPTNGGGDTSRTIDWVVNDGNTGNGASSTSTSTLDTVHVAPTITTGGTATFTGGGGGVPLDSTLSVSDPDSGGLLNSGTVSIVGFHAGDILSATTTGLPSITTSYNSATGVLTLSGSDTLADYQAVLRSVTYSFNPADGDPTNGGSITSHTIDWTINDGVAVSNTGTSTLDEVHAPPTVTAGGTATFTGGGSAVPLDTTLTVSDPDSGGNLTGATIEVGTGFITGDTLNFSTQNGITGTYNSATGTLTLSGTTTLGNYQTALDSITYSFGPTNGDPTGGGADTSRTMDWVATDGVATSSTATSTLNTVHVAPTLAVTGASTTYPEHGAPVPLASSVIVTDPDSLGNLAGATVSISGPLGADMLNFTTQPGITGSYNVTQGELTLTGSATIANYEAALQSVTYSSSGDPTGGGSEFNRTIAWQVNDGVANSAVDDTSLSTLCFCAGTQIATSTGEVPVEQLAVGDLVLTLDGRLVPINWIGTGQSLLPHGGRSPATPVIVRAGALGAGASGEAVPRRDLRITKGHSLYLEGVLIPVENLINHRTILWDDAARSVVVYHIELATHEILLANGAPAESYRDDGNRVQFQNVNPGWDVTPVLEPFAPIVTNGKLVEALWQRLALRAEPDMPIALTEDPDLHLRVDGMRVAPSMARHGIHAFEIMPGATDVQIASRSAIPSELGLNGDHRRLGVAVQRIVLRQQGLKLEIDAESTTLEAGFQRYEHGGGFRWTDGAGILPPSALAVFAAGQPVGVEVYVAHTARYRAPEQQAKLAEAA